MPLHLGPLGLSGMRACNNFAARALPCGCGSKLNWRGYAGFGPCVHLPRFHFGSGFFEPQPCLSMSIHGALSCQSFQRQVASGDSVARRKGQLYFQRHGVTPMNSPRCPRFIWSMKTKNWYGGGGASCCSHVNGGVILTLGGPHLRVHLCWPCWWGSNQ